MGGVGWEGKERSKGVGTTTVVKLAISSLL